MVFINATQKFVYLYVKLYFMFRITGANADRDFWGVGVSINSI